MNLCSLADFFMWCTIINVGILILWSLISRFSGDWAYSVHSKWFPIPRETFNTIHYSFIGGYKVFVTVFNVVPYVALKIIC